MKTKTAVNQFVAREDVGFVLEPIAKALLAQGESQADTLEMLREPAKRVLRISLSDAGEKLSVKELDVEAGRAVQELLADVQKPQQPSDARTPVQRTKAA